MALEASIVERLQELRSWQAAQQERLLQHQQEQRETLSREQIRMYQALGLSVQNNSDEESKDEPSFQDSLEGNDKRVASTTKSHENISRTNVGDIDTARHLSPKIRHELLHNSIIADLGNAKHLSPQRRHELLHNSIIGDIDTARHLSPQRRHELLHKSSPSLITDDENAHNAKDVSLDSDPRSSHRSLTPEMKSPTTVEANQSSVNIENKFLDPCDKNSNKATDSDESNVVFDNEEEKRETNFKSEPYKPRRIIPLMSIDGVEPLPIDRPTNKSLIIDDIPVPSPRKDFHTLLEERLRESEYVPKNDGSITGNERPIKRPFLRKGQGLARFRSGTLAENSTKQIRPRTMSLPSTVRRESNKGVKTNTDKSNDVSKSVKSCTTKAEKIQKKHIPVPSRAQTRLNLKNVQPPARFRSKSMSNSREPSIPLDDQLTENDRFNTSDIESKTKRELEEVRIFELLEEKAENSSFCSTSSTVVALLQQSVQSTPLKSKIVNKNKVSTLAQNWRNEKDDKNEDLLLAEIVYTTQSNSTVHNSMACKKQYQNEFSNSNMNKDSEPVENARNQFLNVDNFDENSIDNICELPYGTDIDPNYGGDYPIIDETNYTNDKHFGGQINYEKNTSLHVRFSEYNEYKTIGLTDTSTISTESEAPRHYSDERAWSDCSVTTDSSDTEEFTSIIQDDKFNNFDSQASLKNKPKAIKPEQKNGKNYKNRYFNDPFHNEVTEGHSDSEIESEVKGYNYHDGIADDEVFNSGSEQDDTHEDSGAENEASALADSTLVEEESDSVKTQEENGLVFKSELLKTRLLELEREIEIFRKENIAVTTLKEKLQEERRVLERNFKEKESRFEERKQKLESTLQEEKKRLLREKLALENRLKDAQVKAQQSKQERLEVQSLKDQLEELKEEMSQKESRWNAAQARHRSQVRILQSENSKLKQEIEKLENAQKAKTKARLHPKHIKFSNTKAIHQINKQLESQKQPPCKQDSSSDEEEFLMQPMMEAMHLNKTQNDHGDFDRINSDGSRMIIYDRAQMESKNRNSIARKRDLYQNLLKDATMGLKESEEATKRAVQSLEDKNNSSKSNEKLANPVREIIEIHDPVDADEILVETGFDPRNNLLSTRSRLIAETGEVASKNSNNGFENNKNEENHLKDYIPSVESGSNNQATNIPAIKNSSNSKTNVKVDKQGIREVQHPDGRVELWYPNGNVKKISADGTISKLIYYNGDVSESRKDGSVKYFYATKRTWHTTMSDGLEILEFPDGQVERRSKDGTVEISFPDGSVRILQSNGTEKWALPDGTLAETSADGDKILILPNGQREVHTKDHKRREYPDGTVKLVYLDGSQETRYANGRVRLKDKDGNLLMDSYHQ